MGNTRLKCVELDLYLRHVIDFTTAGYINVSDEAKSLADTMAEKYRQAILNELAKRWVYVIAKEVGLSAGTLIDVRYIHDNDGCFVEFAHTAPFGGIEQALQNYKDSTGLDLQGDECDIYFAMIAKYFGSDFTEILWAVGSHDELAELTCLLADE